MLIFDGNFGVFHEGVWSVYCAEGSLFLQDSTFAAHCQPVDLISGRIFVCGERCILIGAAVSRSCVIDGTSMIPGVLFHVTQWWRHFAVFKTCLAVGLHICMMVGKSVM